MEQETLIYIEEKDRNEASRLAGGFTLEETQKRAYVNALGSKLAMKYLAQENISVSNVHNLHNIHKLREEFDIADVILPNIHIDVRIIYDEEYIFIPKLHFEYELTPDIYLVFHMADDSSYVKFLGFFEPKLINKNNQNENYYFIEKEKLSHPSDLKNYILNFKGNTTEALTEEELDNGRELGISLIDHDINKPDKKNLIKLLLKSSTLREDLIEFDNFEWLSYHVATSENLETTAEEFLNNETTFCEVQQPDEFDIFDQKDEFDDSLDFNETEEDHDVEDFINNDTINTDESTTSDELLEEPIINGLEIEEHNSDEIKANDEISEELEPIESYSIENTAVNDLLIDDNNLFDEIKIDEEDFTPENTEITEPEVSATDLTDNFESQDDFEQSPGLSTNETEIELDDLQEISEPLLGEDISNEGAYSTISDENSETEISAGEKIHLSEFSELPFDTSDAPINEDLISVDGINDPISNFDSEIVNEETLLSNSLDEEINVTNFDELGEREDIQPVEEVPYQDDEITQMDSIPPLETDVESENNIEDYNENLTPLSGIEKTDDDVNSEDLNEENTVEKVSFNEIDQLFSNEPSDEIDDEEDEDETLKPVGLNELLPDNKLEETEESTLASISAENEIDTEEFSNPNNIVSYENSKTITNTELTPGEISIDINQTEPTTENEKDDLEKLEILYNSSSIEDNTSEINVQNAAPEKGKKAVLIASTIIVALAGLLVYATLNKNSDKVSEQNNANILEDNLPKLEEQQIPESDIVTPVKPSSNRKLDDIAKETAANINKPNTQQLAPAPYLEVKKLSWSVPDYVSYNDEFKKYLQTAGRSLKLSLSSDLLLATEYAYSNEIQVNVILSKEGTIKDAKILKSSGSNQIDEIVLRTVNDTLKVVKAPAGIIVGDNIQLTLKIYL